MEKKGPRALREFRDILLHNDHERDGVKHFWHILKVIDTSHEHFKFLSCRFCWNFVLKITRRVFWFHSFHIFNFQKQDYTKYCRTNKNKLSIRLKTFHLKALSKTKKRVEKTWQPKTLTIIFRLVTSTTKLMIY